MTQTRQFCRQIWISLVMLWGATHPALALAGGECRISGLTLTSDIPGVPTAAITLIADERTKSLRHFEVDINGKTSRVSANSVDVLLKVMSSDFKDEPAVFQFDHPTPAVEQVTAQIGNGALSVDLNLDGAPEVTALKVSGNFSRKTGGTWTLDAYRSPNPFSPRAKLDITLKRDGDRCEDWGFYVKGKSGERQISGLYFKGNTLLGNVIGVDEILPVDFDPNALQKVIGQLTQPARSLENSRISDRLAKNTVLAVGTSSDGSPTRASGSARSAI